VLSFLSSNNKQNNVTQRRPSAAIISSNFNFNMSKLVDTEDREQENAEEDNDNEPSPVSDCRFTHASRFEIDGT
jgi:hypothetical protein